MSQKPSAAAVHLAHQIRQQWVRAMDSVIVELVPLMESALTDTLSQPMQPGTSIERLNLLQETGLAFKRERRNWAAKASEIWQKSLSVSRPTNSGFATLGLLEDEAVTRKITAARMAASVLEAAATEFNNLRLRMQQLEGTRELPPGDVLRPETLITALLQAWSDCGLHNSVWDLVQPVVLARFKPRFAQACKQANEVLVQRGVMAEIDLRALVRRADDASARGGTRSLPDAVPETEPGALTVPGHAPTQTGAPAAPGADAPGHAGQANLWAAQPRSWAERRAPSRTPSEMGVPPMMGGGGGVGGPVGPGRAGGMPAGAGGPGFAGPTAMHNPQPDTRLATSLVLPLMGMRSRAQGVLGQLWRLLTDRVADFERVDANAPVPAPSSALAKALAESDSNFMPTRPMGAAAGEPATVPMQQMSLVADGLRRRASELKARAERPSEKAIIETVALMFQSILSEDRIPSSVRVWFARLQMPVLRLALTEPDFFASPEHPARQLIDSMGSCVLGFDSSNLQGSRLEAEIKRVVQMIEQYPDTGRRVYQLVLDEFKQFLSRHLAGEGAAHKAATLAQQVEQKEALTVQYTIELRRMLDGVTVPDEVREFFFKVWSEVLAVAAVRRGPQEAETLRFKQAAADLLWSVSPKPDRGDRGRVIQQLPGLLHLLRDGMRTLAVGEADQDIYIKRINNAVMQAFVSRGESLPAEKLAELERMLAALEDVVTDDAEGDVLLDPGMIELMFGSESDGVIEVIAQGGAEPGQEVLAWARGLELGAWFGLKYQDGVSQVQYVWRSQRGQLHVFSAGASYTYLVQTRRLASYLQAGLLVPLEEDKLTVRATRNVLNKLKDNPHVLLA